MKCILQGETGSRFRHGTQGPQADAGWLQPGPGAGEEVDRLARNVRESPLRRAVERLAATLKKRARP